MERGEIAASRAAWLMLLLAGPLVGHAFVTAVGLYAEASGAAGGPAALSQGLSPLDGILVPTFGAYDLAAALLYPFVAIRLVAEEKATGAGKLLLQSLAGTPARLAVKTAALAGFWLLAWLPGLLALLLWKFYGGHLWPAETANLMLGHVLRFLLATGVAVAAAAVAESAASAAIVTLSFTLGTWALDFVAAGRGGLLERVARATPTAALRVFEHGELRVASVAAFLAVTAGAFFFALVWLDPRRSGGSRLLRGALTVAATAVLATAASSLRPSWDLSEDRRNSFSRADEAALRRIGVPVTISVALAPEDPRLFDYQRNVLTRLSRVLPRLTVRYPISSASGLFERAGSGYGEITYDVGGHRATLRSTTEPIVLEQIYRLAGVEPPTPGAETTYPGYPLATRAPGASLLFFGAWPLAAGLALFLLRGPWRSRCKAFS